MNNHCIVILGIESVSSSYLPDKIYRLCQGTATGSTDFCRKHKHFNPNMCIVGEGEYRQCYNRPLPDERKCLSHR